MPSIIADFPKEHHSSSSSLFLSSAEKKYWLVGECLQYLFRCRVSRKTFNFILNRIAPLLVWQTVTEEPIMPALRFAICLYRLGRGDYFYTISEMSGLGIYTVSSICQEVRQVLVDHLWNETVNSHASEGRGVQTKNSLHGRVWAISLLLNSNRWLSYSHEMPNWSNSGMQRVP